MPLEGGISRRRWLACGIAGAAFGGGWAAALRATSMPSHAMLFVAGDGLSQLALLDTSRLRVLMVLGAPTRDLIDQVPAMMTVLRQRIDLVIAEEPVADDLGDDFMHRWSVGHQLLIPAINSASPTAETRGRSRVQGDMSVDLANHCRLQVRVSPRQEWLATLDQEPRRDWSITLLLARNVVLLAPHTSAAAATSNTRPSLVVTPGPDPDLVLSKLTPGAIAMNVDHLDGIEPSAVVLRTYRDEIARIEIRDDGITLPPWAEHPHSSDSVRS